MLFEKTVSYKEWRNAIPDSFKGQQPFNMRLPVQGNWETAKRKILLVLEHVDTEDLRSPKRQLATGPSGSWLSAAVSLGQDYARHCEPRRAAYAAINFNYFKTYDLDGSRTASANEAASARVHAYAKKMGATDVIVFGDLAACALMQEIGSEYTLLLRRGRPTKLNGVWWTNTISPSLAYQGKFVADNEDEDESESKVDHANLLGFIGRCVGNALARRLAYSFEAKPKVRLVNDYVTFKKLYKVLMSSDRVAVDTETSGLGRVVNQVLTIQFAFDANRSYVVPLDHKDAKWTPQERTKIEKGLRNFFARRFDPLSKSYDQYLLGQNLKFDLTILRQRFSLYNIRWRVWDMMAGAYCLDENMKSLLKCRTPLSGKISPYRLDWMCAWYGCDFYENNAFSKADRATIETRSLDEPGLMEYCGMDAQVCWAIHDQQRLQASRQRIGGRDYGRYYNQFVVTQMNNLVQIESVMEHRGDQLDMPYLIQLKDRNGPLSTLRRDVEKEFTALKGVRRANRRLAKTAGVPQQTLWGKDSWIFSPSKPAHKQELFINVLQLEPLAYGKTGPKIDKAFQEHYKDVPEVAAFTQISQLDKLRSTYVNGFYDKLKTDPDMKGDFRIRPGFGFTGTVTGRSNSYDPNLQNIPARGKFAKYIKRMFVAPRGCLTLKMDYSSHEVRMWGVVSGDAKLCELFVNGRWLRQQYRTTGNPLYKQLMDTKGDIHKVNCVSGDTLIATDRGLVRIDSLGKSGVERMSVSTMTHGGAAKTSHWKNSGTAKCLVIKTELGNSITVTSDHRVAVWDDSSGELSWKEAKNITIEDVLVLAPKGVLRKSKLQLSWPKSVLHRNAKPLARLPKAMTPDLSWLIGCLVSEGSIGSYPSGKFVTFSNSDLSLVQRFVQIFQKVFGEPLSIGRSDHDKVRSINGVLTSYSKPHYGVRLSSMHLIQVLKHLGLYVDTGRVDNKIASWRKLIPWSVLESDGESQLAFLSAYLECDGNVENRSGVLRWFSVSGTLIDQMRTLLNAHGVFPVTGSWKTVQALTLTGADSAAIWPKLAPYMVTKRLTVAKRRANSGVPAKYWSDLIASRLSNRGRNATTDTGKIVSMSGRTNYFGKIKSLSQVLIKEHQNYLRRISVDGHNKLCKVAKANYRFSRVVSITPGGLQPVFDLTMTGNNPSFVANGVIVHNCEFFFKVEAADVTKEQRNAVKSIVFGAIYGRGPRAIAAQTGQQVEEVVELLEAFFARFTKASGWLATAKKTAVKEGLMYSPIYRVRNMHTQRYGMDSFKAATERRGCNAPIQGFAADIGHTAAYLYQLHLEDVVRKFNLDSRAVLAAGVNTFVHDAIKTDAPYDYLLVCLQVLQWCATTGAMQYYKRHWGVRFDVEVEIEFELAAHDEQHWKFDWHEGSDGNEDGGGLRYCIRKSLEDQKAVYPDIDIDAIEKRIWAIRKNKELTRYLDEHYPVLSDWPDARHIDTSSASFKNGLGAVLAAESRKLKIKKAKSEK
jgi:DNA polymerase I-like protein with 3'-5' exonuclease and polymerase domains